MPGIITLHLPLVLGLWSSYVISPIVMLYQSSEDDDDNVEVDFKSLVSIFQQGLKGLNVPPYKL